MGSFTGTASSAFEASSARMHRRPVDRLDQIAGEELTFGGTSRIHELQERAVAVILRVVGQPAQHHVGGVDLALVHLRERPLLLLLGRLTRRIQRLLGDHRQVGIEPCHEHPHRAQTAEADRRHDRACPATGIPGSAHADQRLHFSRRAGAERVVGESHPPGEEREAEAEGRSEPGEEAFGFETWANVIVREHRSESRCAHLKRVRRYARPGRPTPWPT